MSGFIYKLDHRIFVILTLNKCIEIPEISRDPLHFCPWGKNVMTHFYIVFCEAVVPI